MHDTPVSTHDWTMCQLRLADDLVVCPQVYAGTVHFHLELTAAGKFFRVGFAEYAFLTALNENTTCAQALTVSARALGRKSLTQTQARAVVLWLLENGLAQLVSDSPHPNGGNPSGIEPSSNTQRSGSKAAFNPLWMKISLGSPDRFFAAILPWVAWLFSPWATLVGAIAIVAGAAVLGAHWPQFVADSYRLIAPTNWATLALTWVALKVVHEGAHALACKRYGAPVREWGLLLVLFMPLAYVDVTPCWRLPSKWQRLHVAAAGIFAELVLAALAAWVWAATESPTVRLSLAHLIVMATVATVLFNANPLMKFDGYYLLADLLEFPNLAQQSAGQVRAWATRFFWGAQPVRTALAGWRAAFATGYGFASLAWQLTVCATLLAAAAVMFQGLGLALCGLALASWLAQPGALLARTIAQRWRESPVSLLRAASLASLTMALLAAALFLAPWPAPQVAPGVVQYAESSVVRSRVKGFVAAVHVQNGEAVKAGDLLLELRNDELLCELAAAEAKLAQATCESRKALSLQEAAKAQVCEQNQAALRNRVDELARQAGELRIFAPKTGTVVSRRVTHLLGTFVREGEELLLVGAEDEKEVLASVGQRDFESSALHLQGAVACHLNSLQRVEGWLARVEPRASKTLTHEALGAHRGGPLPVTEEDGTERGQRTIELVEPRFTAVVAMAPATARQVPAGMRCGVRLGNSQETVAAHLWRRLNEWWDSRWNEPPHARAA